MRSDTPKDLTRARKTLLFNRLRKSSVPVSDSSNDPIEASERGESIPLSYAQQRLWFLSQLSGVSEAYHIHGGVRLRGTLDRVALKGALDRIVERHESLRTCFVQQDGEAVQKIGPAQGFALREERLTVGAAEQEHAL